MKEVKIVIALLLMMVLSSCAPAKEEQVSPPFWVAENPENGAEVYLLGSMHMGKNGTIYPDFIWEFFEKSSEIAVELDTIAFSENTQELSEAADYMRCGDSKTTKDYMNAELYDSAVEFLKSKGIYADGLNEFIPYYWTSYISSALAAECGLKSEYGTEYIFLSRAKELNKTVTELESGTEQYKIMSEIPLSVQSDSLKECIGNDNYAGQIETMNELYLAWSRFDNDKLEELCALKEISGDLADDYYSYYDAMYYSRQEKMADFVIEKLEKGETAFMLVGAMHYYAEPDIINLINEAGYSVAELRGVS